MRPTIMGKFMLTALGALSAALCAADMPRATPESQGVSSKAILEWIDACDAQMKYIHGFVLVRHGRVIAEGTWAPFDTLNEPHMLYSHSKSFTSTAIGFLADEGKLDLDERIADIFADKMPAEPSQRLLQVRVRDLLSMNFGSNPNKGARSDANNPDWEKSILARPMEVADPGRKHRYDSDATYLLSCIVERKSGKRTMEYLKEKLFDPLGMTSPWSTVSTSGTACGGWGMNMTTRDIAKFGQLLLNEGVWDGKRILSKDWVRLATSKQTATSGGPESDWAQGYGFQFWRCRHGAYRADGAAGQFTIVMEDQGAVLSINAGDNDMQRSLNLVWKHILPALGPSALPEDAAAQAKLAERCASLKLPVLENKGVEGAALPASASFGRSDILNAGEGRLGAQGAGARTRHRRREVERDKMGFQRQQHRGRIPSRRQAPRRRVRCVERREDAPRPLVPRRRHPEGRVRHRRGVAVTTFILQQERMINEKSDSAIRPCGGFRLRGG